MERVRRDVEKSGGRIASLREGLKHLDEERLFAKAPFADMEPYDGHLGIDSCTSVEQRGTYTEMRSLLGDLVEDVIVRRRVDVYIITFIVG